MDAGADPIGAGFGAAGAWLGAAAGALTLTPAGIAFGAGAAGACDGVGLPIVAVACAIPGAALGILGGGIIC